MQSWTALGAQAMLAFLGLLALRRGCAILQSQRAATTGEGEASLLLEIWLPLAIVMPMLMAAGSIRGNVATTSRWIVVGGPVLCGIMGLAAALMSRSHTIALSRRAMVLWTASGIVLLMIAAANELTVVVGQLLFAIAAVMLWINTPEATEELAASGGASKGHATPPRGAGLVLLAFMIAGAHGAAALAAGTARAETSHLVMLAYAAASIVAIARLAGGPAAAVVGGWAATYGLTFGLGIMSLAVIVPRALHALVNGAAPPISYVASGFAAYAPEAAAMIVLAAAVAYAGRLSRALSAACVLAFALGAVALALWRLGIAARLLSSIFSGKLGLI